MTNLHIINQLTAAQNMVFERDDQIRDLQAQLEERTRQRDTAVELLRDFQADDVSGQDVTDFLTRRVPADLW